ncbi:response regulator receiver domain protein [Ceratobasidium sp. AG-Ba]|nr:response regulator receiver domain protein [Ceratobasidium sp. AG-Ba]
MNTSVLKASPLLKSTIRTMATAPSKLVPPFTRETAHAKVKAAQDLWNTQNPERIALAYTENSIWRNRTSFVTGRPEIVDLLKHNCPVLVRIPGRSGRHEVEEVYGLEDWTFDESGLMRKRHMSGNDMEIQDGERFFKGLTTDEVEKADISEHHW